MDLSVGVGSVPPNAVPAIPMPEQRGLATRSPHRSRRSPAGPVSFDASLRRIAVAHASITALVVRLKSVNPGWGQRRIRDGEFRPMGIRVSEPSSACDAG